MASCHSVVSGYKCSKSEKQAEGFSREGVGETRIKWPSGRLIKFTRNKHGKNLPQTLICPKE
jgi:hypothetical protein